jgi:hypothetical protein
MKIPPAVVRDDRQIEQRGQRHDLVACTSAQVRRRRHRAARRKHIIDQQHAPVTPLHFQNARSIFERIGDIDHWRRKLALFAYQGEPLMTARGQGGTENEAA